MIDVPARRSPKRAQPGGGHRVPISPPARKENHEEMKRTGAQSWCFLLGKLVFCGRDGERDDREARSRQNIRVERDESRRKAKPPELERQARCKRRATAASRRSARAHLLGRASRAAESSRPQRAPLLRLLFPTRPGPGGPLPTRALDLGHRQSRSGGEPNKPRVRINLMAYAKMADVPARRTPRRAQPGGGHRPRADVTTRKKREP